MFVLVVEHPFYILLVYVYVYVHVCSRVVCQVSAGCVCMCFEKTHRMEGTRSHTLFPYAHTAFGIGANMEVLLRKESVKLSDKRPPLFAKPRNGVDGVALAVEEEEEDSVEDEAGSVAAEGEEVVLVAVVVLEVAARAWDEVDLPVRMVLVKNSLLPNHSSFIQVFQQRCFESSSQFKVLFTHYYLSIEFFRMFI